MKSSFSSEDIFEAGFKAGYDAMDYDEGPDREIACRDAYTAFRYKQLKENEGLESAQEFERQRRSVSKPEDVKCPECEGPMVERTGKYGTFWGCKKYPSCTGTRDSQGRSKYDRKNELSAADRLEKDDLAQNTERVRTTFKKG